MGGDVSLANPPEVAVPCVTNPNPRPEPSRPGGGATGGNADVISRLNCAYLASLGQELLGLSRETGAHGLQDPTRGGRHRTALGHGPRFLDWKPQAKSKIPVTHCPSWTWFLDCFLTGGAARTPA